MVRKDIPIVILGILGTILEWAEYSFFGYMSTKISQLFFPQIDPQASLLATFGIFAAGFLMRPLGASLFGHIGDSQGRKKALSNSLLLMGGATFLMSITPTYETIGIWAPIFLLICRLLQGLALGGEFNGAAIFLIEHSMKQRSTLAGSWIGAAVAMGMMFGASLAAIISMPSMPEWSWRLPFALGCILCLLGSYLRTKFQESPLFVESFAKKELLRLPFKEVFIKHKTALVTTAICGAFVGISTYVCNLYFVTFLINNSHFPPNTARFVAAFGQLCIVALFPFVGIWADHWKGKTLILIGLTSATFLAPLIFILGMQGSVKTAMLSQFCYAIFNALTCAPIFKYIFDLFPTNLRYTGNSFAWSLSIAIFGGTAPMVSEYLNQVNLSMGPPLYVSLFAFLAATAIILHSKDKREIVQI